MASVQDLSKRRLLYTQSVRNIQEAPAKTSCVGLCLWDSTDQLLQRSGRIHEYIGVWKVRTGNLNAQSTDPKFSSTVVPGFRFVLFFFLFFSDSHSGWSASYYSFCLGIDFSRYNWDMRTTMNRHSLMSTALSSPVNLILDQCVYYYSGQ
jgi:hypothetical protein